MARREKQKPPETTPSKPDVWPPFEAKQEELLELIGKMHPAVELKRVRWPVEVVLLGRVHDERLFIQPAFGLFSSCSKWASSKLEMGEQEYHRALELYKMVLATKDPEKTVFEAMEPSEWGEIPKAKALVLLPIWKASENVRPWWEKAKGMDLDDLKNEVYKVTGGELWKRWGANVPASMLDLLEGALLKAAPLVLTEPGEWDADPGRLTDPTIRFRLIEYIAQHFIATTPEHVEGA